MLDGKAKEVIGVLPESFRFLDRKFDIVEIYQFDRGKVFVGNFSFRAIACLKPGVTITQASADVARKLPMLPRKFKLAPGMSAQVFENTRMAPLLRPLKSEIIGDSASVLWLLMVTVGIVLFIACANVANLLLVKADGRQQELAVRAALGASRARIAAEMLRDIAAKLAEIPRVGAVGLKSGVTMDGSQSMDLINVEDRPVSDTKMPTIRTHKRLGPGYFIAMGNPLAAGRDFN